jgi:hypothetical protein
MKDKFQRNKEDYKIEMTFIFPKEIKIENFKKLILQTPKITIPEDLILIFKNCFQN